MQEKKQDRKGFQSDTDRLHKSYSSDKKLSEECIMAETCVYIVDNCVVLAVATNTLTHQRDKP